MKVSAVKGFLPNPTILKLDGKVPDLVKLNKAGKVLIAAKSPVIPKIVKIVALVWVSISSVYLFCDPVSIGYFVFLNLWYIQFMAHLKVITGPMFSGKTEELIRILHRSDLAGKRIVVVKPRIDVRSSEEIASRRTSGGESRDFAKSGSFPATPIDSADELAELMKKTQPNILAIDEAQFFEPWMYDYLSELLKHLSNTDLIVLVAGLDMDAWGRPFGIMPQLMALADEVQKETAICFRCKKPAILSQKLGSSSEQVEVGDIETYEARCRVCHVIPPLPQQAS